MLRRDDLMNGYIIWQDTDLFCFGIDAVLLAHYPSLRRGDNILDLCTGFAPVPLILSAEASKKGYPVRISGIEIQESAASCARRSVSENGLDDTVRIVTGDIRKAGEYFAPASFSLITCNPPYLPVGSGFVSENDSRAAARTELSCTLKDVVSAAGRLLKMSGRFAMIHRPERLPEIFARLEEYRLTPKRMRLVQPRVHEEPTMVLIEAVRGARPSLKVEAPLIVYENGSSYTEEINAIYGRNTVSGGDADRQS